MLRFTRCRKTRRRKKRRQRSQGREGRSNIFQITGSVDKKATVIGETFRSYSRQACNFVIPDINKDINEMKRPGLVLMALVMLN